MAHSRIFTTRAVPAAAMLSAPSAAWAHAGDGPHLHVMSGFLHPLGGLDHLLAMIAVGLLASALGGRALWGLPLSFLSLMVVGGVMGMAGLALPFVEPAIALSVVAFGFALVACKRWTVAAAMALVGSFAVFHGLAHGAEIPQGAVAPAYVAGFVAATALLHIVGIAIGLKAERIAMPQGMHFARLGGAVFAVAGLGLLIGRL